MIERRSLARTVASVSSGLRKARRWQGHWRRMLSSSDYRRSTKMIERAQRLEHGGVPREQRLQEHMRIVRRRAETLTPRPVRESADDEIHMLTGRAQTGMGCLALWSLLRWIPFDVAVYLHSDGSLTWEDAQTWRRLFPNLNVVLEEEVGPIRDEFFAGGRYPHLREFALNHVYFPKLIDFHLVGPGERRLILDTDVLFFRRPDELLNVWREARVSGERVFSTFNDMMNAFMGPLEQLEPIIGPVPRRFNSGLNIIPRLGPLDFQDVESMLGRVARQAPKFLENCWVEQTTYAWLAVRSRMHRLSRDYIVGGTEPGATSVHFAGVFRELFFTEGVPLILGDEAPAVDATATAETSTIAST